MSYRYILLTVALLLASTNAVAKPVSGLQGKVTIEGEKDASHVSVYLKGTSYGCFTDEQGTYRLIAPSGQYTMVVSSLGYTTAEQPVDVALGVMTTYNISLESDNRQLDEVVVVSTGVSRVKQSAFNAVALETKELQNSTKNLGEALSKIPGMKLRESGGVGSDMQLTLDGFSGKHIKVFIDGVPQEGVGSSFSINNIPVSFADRIEVYKGVVPVGFGTDAIGGVINIVTKKKRRNWFLDASYSYGSFNTHRTNVHFGQSFDNGLTYEINAFQNYSDNNYYVNAPVEDFETGRIDKNKKEHVQRFNDTYHNEAAVAKVGFVQTKWADRLMLGFTYSHMYKEIQTGVRQEIVYGEKHRKGYSLMPSLEYRKRNIFTEGLDVTLTANYNRNITTNVDTSSYKYNWVGDKKLLNSPGEQSYQHSRVNNDNWNATLNFNYRLGDMHLFTLNHVFNSFHRSNTSLLAVEEQTQAIDKETCKNITGLSYRLMPNNKWNISVFGKYYNQFVAGPVATSSNQSEYVRTTRNVDSWGYGIAGTYFIIPSLQAKVSYEKAYRLPTIEEMFGDEDLEIGDVGIRPENSHNVNVNLAYNQTFDTHSLYAEAGLVYRNTNDYIQRNITDLSGGKSAATYINYGKVQTLGYNLSVRYSYSKWLSIGANFTQMDVRDNMPTALGSSVPNLSYKERMPNIPYMFADSDISFYWNDLFGKGNKLTVTYDNQYMHSFTYYSSNIGANKGDYIVPDQFSHNVSVAYSLHHGRYNFIVECRNITDELLYDNFSLQKAGRAFYGKIRVYFGK
ncbi:MAG: TonB-dependent receptor [Muribaculaceae bacterium]|nr:TonB-dependent receptor [Muribaculaceae bacterium]